MKDYEIVFFDVFDTLIVRNCKSFENLWKLVEKEADKVLNKKTNFWCKRFEAESSFYKEGMMTPSISDIYSRLAYNERELKYLFNLEHEVEYSVCEPNYSLKKIFDSYKSLGKKIFAVSDMYYSSEFINGLLKKCGYSIDGLVVSNEEKCTKKDGALFDVLVKKYDLDNMQIVHYGDNEISDIEGANKSGIDAIKINPQNTNTVYLQKSNRYITDTVLFGFINNNIPSISDRCMKIGFETLGPLILGYCQWLHNRKRQLGIKNMLFCSRDLYQSYKWYIKLYPDEKDDVSYLFISLKSLSIPYKVSKNPEHAEFKELEQYNLLKEYIKSLLTENEFILADSGFGGHTQMMLERVLGEDYKIHGAYIRMTQSFKNRSKAINSAAAYLYNNNPSPKARISGGFFESIIQATHGRTLAYTKGGDGKVKPVLGEEKKDVLAITNIQNGIDYFVDEWIKRGYLKYKINEKMVGKAFMNLTFYPCREDVKLLSDLQGGNSRTVKMVEGTKFSIYNNPVCFLRGLQKTYWKGGYLSKGFKHYKFISRIYVFLDTLYLKFRGF